MTRDQVWGRARLCRHVVKIARSSAETWTAGRDAWPSDDHNPLSDYMRATSRARHYVSGPERVPIEQVPWPGSPGYLALDESPWARPCLPRLVMCVPVPGSGSA